MGDLGWGLQMTAVGMGTVFALLAVLMGVLLLIGRLDNGPASAASLAAPETAPAELAADPPGPPVVELLSGGLTVEQAAAVTLAVVTHAEVRRQEAAPEMRTFAPGSQIHASRWVAVGRGQQNQSWKRR